MITKKIRTLFMKLLAEQPELIIPDLPNEVELKKTRNLAIAEVAGRDSVAAVIKACQERPIEKVLPTVAYNGCQYGSLESVYFAVELMSKRVGKKKVLEPVMLGSPEFWKALTIRFSDVLTERFGFYTPYVACHLYIHAIRVPLAKRLNCKLIISGERESHNGQIKINQTPGVLDYYAKLLSYFDIELLQPLRKTVSSTEVIELLGREWASGKQQLHCVLSGNYKDPDGSVDYGEGRRFSDAKSARFLEHYGLPLAKVILEKLGRGEAVDYEKEAINQLASLQVYR